MGHGTPHPITAIFLLCAASYTHVSRPKVPDYDDDEEGYKFDVVRTLTPQVV